MEKFATRIKKIKSLFTPFEWILWLSSMFVIIFAYLYFKKTELPFLFTSLIGVTCLIFVAKGNVIGHILGAFFMTAYSIISFLYGYYGEVVSSACLSLPVAVASIVTWLRNPYQGNRQQVKVNRLHAKDYFCTLGLGLIVAFLFYWILKALHTEELILGTASVFTSFLATFLSMRRSPSYALCYMANDIVLIVLWAKTAMTDPSAICMMLCFSAFLVNDAYGFRNWKRLEAKQTEKESPKELDF